MELNGAKILYTIHTDIPFLGDFKITQTLVSTWIVMALLSGFAIWLGRNLKLENVSKRQAAAEFIVTRLDQFVHDNMGYHFDQYIPLIGSIFGPKPADSGVRLRYEYGKSHHEKSKAEIQGDHLRAARI